MANDRPAPPERPPRPPRPEAKKPTPPPPGRNAGGGGKGAGAGGKGPASGGRRPPARRKRRIDKKQVLGIVGGVLALGLIVYFASSVLSNTNTPPSVGANANGPEEVAIPKGDSLGAINTAVYGQAIDGIKCETNEQVVYHIHAHLAIFVDGKSRQIPQGIGIAPPLQVQNGVNGASVAGGNCFYWLHTHAADGIIHVESPNQTQYTLGQFFDMWGQILAPDQVGPAVGKVTAFVDGKPFPGNPRTIPLSAHGVIQLDVGSVVPFRPLDLSQTKL